MGFTPVAWAMKRHFNTDKALFVVFLLENLSR